MSVAILLRVNTSNEFNDELPSFALLEWTRDLGQAIARARTTCVTHGYRSVRLNASALWFTSLPDHDQAEEGDGTHDSEAIDPSAAADADADAEVEAQASAEAWADIHSRLEDDGEDYVLLTAEQAAMLRDHPSQRGGIRGEAIVVEQDGDWFLTAYCKYSDDRVQTPTVPFGNDPWAEAHGYPDVRLCDERAGLRFRLRLDPHAIHALQQATRLVDAAPQVAVSVPVAVTADSSNHHDSAPPQRWQIASAPWHDRPAPGRASIERFDFSLALRDAPSDAPRMHFGRNEWCELLRQAGQHLSLVEA